MIRGFRNKDLRSDAGFTLIEIMVVIVVIGIMSSFVMLNLPDGTESLDEGTEKIAARFTVAAREAVLSGEAIGVSLTRSGYSFLRLRKGVWQNFTLILKQDLHTWPEGTLVTLRINGERQILPRVANTTKRRFPFLYFTPTGESGSFELSLAKLDDQKSISSNSFSQISVGN